MNILCSTKGTEKCKNERERDLARELEKLQPSINKQLVRTVQIESTVIVLYKYLRSIGYKYFQWALSAFRSSYNYIHLAF